MPLISEKKSKAGMKSETQFSREKQRILPIFESFVRNEINLGIDSIMQPICIYFSSFKVYPKK